MDITCEIPMKIACLLLNSSTFVMLGFGKYFSIKRNKIPPTPKINKIMDGFSIMLSMWSLKKYPKIKAGMTAYKSFNKNLIFNDKNRL